VKLSTTAFRALESDPAIGRAEAFRRAMLAMIDDAGKSGNPASKLILSIGRLSLLLAKAEPPDELGENLVWNKRRLSDNSGAED
jgi:hypothetical protein